MSRSVMHDLVLERLRDGKALSPGQAMWVAERLAESEVRLRAEIELLRVACTEIRSAVQGACLDDVRAHVEEILAEAGA